MNCNLLFKVSADILEDVFVVHSKLNVTELKSVADAEVESAQEKADFLDSVEYDPKGEVDLSKVPTNIQGTDDKLIFWAATRKVSFWKRRIIRQSLQLSIESAKGLTNEIDINIDILQGVPKTLVQNKKAVIASDLPKSTTSLAKYTFSYSKSVCLHLILNTNTISSPKFVCLFIMPFNFMILDVKCFGFTHLVSGFP